MLKKYRDRMLRIKSYYTFLAKEPVLSLELKSLCLFSDLILQSLANISLLGRCSGLLSKLYGIMWNLGWPSLNNLRWRWQLSRVLRQLCLGLRHVFLVLKALRPLSIDLKLWDVYLTVL